MNSDDLYFFCQVSWTSFISIFVAILMLVGLASAIKEQFGLSYFPLLEDAIFSCQEASLIVASALFIDGHHWRVFAAAAAILFIGLVLAATVPTLLSMAGLAVTISYFLAEQIAKMEDDEIFDLSDSIVDTQIRIG